MPQFPQSCLLSDIQCTSEYASSEGLMVLGDSDGIHLYAWSTHQMDILSPSDKMMAKKTMLAVSLI